MNQEWRRTLNRGLLILWGVWYCAWVGCDAAQTPARDVEAEYGKQSPASARKSVNGTAVLAEMYRAQGHHVETWSRMSPRMDDYDTIVWIPDCYSSPDDRVCDRIEMWLNARSGRTFVYVGRQYDAEEDYWQTILEAAEAANEPAERIEELRRRLAYARSRVDFRRRQREQISVFDEEHTELIAPPFSIRDVNAEKIEGAWAGSFDASASDIMVYPTSDPEPLDVIYHETREPLLVVNGIPVVVRYVIPELYGGRFSELIYVQNGSFLLNLPLVNHEHRQLAAAIIDESYPDQDVLFLESGGDGIEVIDHVDQPRQSTPWDWVSIWPMNFIVPHLFLFAIVFCVAYFPIFGRAKTEVDEEHVSDFGKHLRALGLLLAKTGQNKYMLQQIQHYEEHVRRDSGTSHGK